MSSVINQLIRMLFWAFFESPIRIGRWLLGGSANAAAIGTQLADNHKTKVKDVEAKVTLVTPTSKQGAKDRKDYEYLLGIWEDALSPMEGLFEEYGVETAMTDPQIPPAFEALKTDVEKLRGYLNDIEARNTGMKELRRARAQYESRQAALEGSVK